MRLLSSSFQDGGIIPSRYTCEGADINPPLEIQEVPKKAKSLVLILNDPDVPKNLRADGMWDHWILFNIPPNIQQIKENSAPAGTAGKTSWGHTQYGGPCPPDREHRYFFKLYALDCVLDLPPGVSKQQLEEAMASHILAEAQLMGRYEKNKGYK